MIYYILFIECDHSGHGERKAEQLKKMQNELHRETQHDQPIVSHNLFAL